MTGGATFTVRIDVLIPVKLEVIIGKPQLLLFCAELKPAYKTSVTLLTNGPLNVTFTGS